MTVILAENPTYLELNNLRLTGNISSENGPLVDQGAAIAGNNSTPAIALATAALDQNPAAAYLASLRLSGRRSMKHYLNSLAALVSNGQHDALSLPWHTLRYQHTAAIRAALQENYHPGTAKTMLAALRRVLKEARRLGLMSAEDYTTAVDFPPIKGESLLRGRALAGGELVALMNACAVDPGPAGARDAALLAVAYAAGLRRSELVKLELADYNSDGGALTIRGGKGGKDRLTYIEAGTRTAIADWLDIRGEWPGPLFVAINKGGRMQIGQRMSNQAILAIFQKRGGEARVKSFSPHDLRRSCISDLLDAGADISTVSKLAGHASVVTTAKYDRRGEVAKQKAAGLLHVPYQKR